MQGQLQVRSSKFLVQAPTLLPSYLGPFLAQNLRRARADVDGDLARHERLTTWATALLREVAEARLRTDVREGVQGRLAAIAGLKERPVQRELMDTGGEQHVTLRELRALLGQLRKDGHNVRMHGNHTMQQYVDKMERVMERVLAAEAAGQKVTEWC